MISLCGYDRNMKLVKVTQNELSEAKAQDSEMKSPQNQPWQKKRLNVILSTLYSI